MLWQDIGIAKLKIIRFHEYQILQKTWIYLNFENNLTLAAGYILKS